MAQHRRYKYIGKNPIYDSEFNRARIASKILNAGSIRPGLDTPFFDKGNCIGYLAELLGDDKGLYIRNGEIQMADIPNLKNRIKKIEQEFKNYQQNQINHGYDKPEQMPAEMEAEKFRLEARVDVMLEEVDFLQERLTKYEEEVEKSDLSKMLTNGPHGNGRLSGGILAEIDGQKIKVVKGNLVIQDENSPYNGIAVIDYRKLICEPWAELTNNLSRFKYNLTQEMLGKGVKNSQLIEEAWKDKQKEILLKFPEFTKLFGLVLPNKPPMPLVPEGIKKYL